MIGFVVVSHSARLAEGVCELAAQVGQGRVALAPAGGTDDPGNPLGTDAFRVQRAIESVWSEDGVLVFTDLGSAVLSAEMALEFLDESRRARVRLCDAPLVEGVVAAVSQAAAGADFEEIAREAEQGSPGKASPAQPAAAGEEAEVALPNRLGLHARPAAQLVRLARRFRARVTLENLTRGAGPADAGRIHGVLAMGARQGHRLRLLAEGEEAKQALAAVRDFLASGCGEADRPPAAAEAPAAPPPAAHGQLAGLPASPGIAIGPLARLRPATPAVAERTVDDPEAECRRLEAAIRGAREETGALVAWAAANAGADEGGIFDAQALFLEDPEFGEAAMHMIRERRVNAEAALQEAGERFASRLSALDDPYLAARAADVADAAGRVLGRLTGAAGAVAALTAPAVVAACDMTPSEVRALDPAMVMGLCLERGSASAHSVILARAMGIPAVVGLGPGLTALPDGALLALDGERGLVWANPGADEVRALECRRESWLAARRAAHVERHRPARTRDGRAVRVFANISGAPEAAEALEYGAEGVGVLRTEFLFLDRLSAPSEEEQADAYAAIAAAMRGRPLVVRTLDVGGDKALPYIDIGPEANPFLGWRGIRLTLGRRDLLRTQLRAVLRAAADASVEVLFPMISTPAELLEAKAVLAEAESELAREGLPYQSVRVGVMIEAPAAAAVADQLARHADFFSIGTNDLVQYAMAADRTNARVAAIADPFQPAVLRMVRQAAAAGRAAGIGVTLCGEMAADPLATALLIGLGLEEFSVSPPLIPELKRAIARTSASEAEVLARQSLELETAEAVRRACRERLA